MKIFWVDCETSGLDSKENGIIQLAYIIEIDGVEKESGELFSNCAGKRMDQSALTINGYATDGIRQFPSSKEMYKKLVSIFSKYVDKYDREDKFTIGGYNVKFDRAFLSQLWYDNGDKYFGSWFNFGDIDPSQIVRFLQYCGWTFPAKMKLIDLAEYFNISTENAHDALADIRMTIDIVKEIKKAMEIKK